MENTAELSAPTHDYSYSYGPVEVQGNSIAKTVAEVRSKVAPYRFKIAARAISRELKLEPEQKVLEIGSGLGLLGKAIKEETDGEIKYHGIELAYKPAKESEKEGLIETQSDTINLPYADNSFDAVVSTDVLEHIPDAQGAVKEINRVLKPGGNAFLVIADPSEARFTNVSDHINRTGKKSNIEYWEKLFSENSLEVSSEKSKKYRAKDWRKVFNHPFLVKLKEKPGFACAFNSVYRPGTYILHKK